MGILYIYRHENLTHPQAGAIIDSLGPRIGPGLMIAAGGGLGRPVWVVNTLTTGWCFYTQGPPCIKAVRPASNAALHDLLAAVCMFVASASGLMATAQRGPIAED
jgi:hypothetical protein